jgi:VWFA-related protein
MGRHLPPTSLSICAITLRGFEGLCAGYQFKAREKTTMRLVNKLLSKALIAVLSLIIFTFTSQAQQPVTSPSADKSPALPTLKVTTRLVIVDVVAADGKGHPITDLKAEDFTLTEEGSSQQIKVFNFQQSTASDPSQQPPAKMPLNLVTNVPSYKPNRALSVLLLDGLNSDSLAQKYARQEMLKYLDKLPQGQPVAIYLLGNKLRLLQDFTTDPDLLKQALGKMKDKNSPLLKSDPALSAAAAQNLAQMGLQGMITQIQGFEQEQVVAQVDQRVENTVNALMFLARTLAGYPGRKNLIWVSSAFPSNLIDLEGLTSVDSRRQASATSGERSYSNEIERLSSALSNARVAVYPVDSHGVGNSGAALGNHDNSDSFMGRAAADPQTAHTTMNTVAERTGGRAFYNTNDLTGAIKDGIEDGSTYYTLGYYPENKDWNGKFRKIVVKANRSGVKLQYRQGYVASDPHAYRKLDPKQQAMDFGQALNLENPIATALPFKSALIMPTERTANKLVINFGIDAHNLSFELQDDGLQHTSVDCAVQVFNSTGAPLHTVQAQNFSAALKPEQYQLVLQKFFPCNQTLALGPGDYLLRLGVRDNTTGLIGTVNAPVTIAAAAPTAKP